MRRTRTKIQFLGTGDAFNTDGRGSQCIWVQPRQGPQFLVDAGPTALAAMGRHRVDPGRIGAIFFTHLHGDHIAGWPFLLLHAKFIARRTAPLAVVGPKGSRNRLGVLAGSCYEEITSPGTLPFRVRFAELPVRRRAGWRSPLGFDVDVVPMDHHPSSIGFRFHLSGATIAVTGDTRWCTGLEELSADSDLLVLECTCLRKPDYAHVSLEELRSGIERLRARRIVLTHLSNEVARALKRRPLPGVTAAEDGMILRIG